MLLLTVPFVWDEHEQPHDFARYTSFGLKHLLQQHGFAVEEYRKSMADTRAVFQMANAYVFKKVQHRGRWTRFLAKAGLVAPINIVGQLAGLVLPGNDDLYLDSIVLARRV